MADRALEGLAVDLVGEELVVLLGIALLPHRVVDVGYLVDEVAALGRGDMLAVIASEIDLTTARSAVVAGGQEDEGDDQSMSPLASM